MKMGGHFPNLRPSKPPRVVMVEVRRGTPRFPGDAGRLPSAPLRACRQGAGTRPLGARCGAAEPGSVLEERVKWRHVSQVLERCTADPGPIVTLNGSFCAQVTAWRIIALDDERASVSGGASEDLELTR